uniref:5'-3' exoribonuclease 1 n=1 Tax=Lygus hesperus TaxID=30085 RepID=A0A0A9XX62_LYGHE
MGVPKFFRYISERYPCINETLKEYQIPEFDNLYLDMNGIIHVCSHDDGLTYCTSEEQIFKDIFYYIELMFRLIQPKKIFMMAVDGVAPRAKMNQQRGRRFRTAKDAEEAEKKLIQSGQELPAGSRFDSNCITPGTEFMARLHEQLKFFVAYKVSTDKLWQKPKIVYSGHNVPGEGEHKIMDYIRYLRSRDDWNPNTRHCLHGLDADLIMLGLCSHEPHFSLLREEVKFTKKQKRPKNPEEIQFFLLHLSLLRDYLDCEFQVLKQKLPFPYDLEKIIDDWVLMGFLVGNDFIPQLPNLHIGNNALHSLYQSYIEILPTLDGYINEGGHLNLERFEKYLDALSKYDLDNYKEISMDLKYFDTKTGKNESGKKPNGISQLGSDNEFDEDDEDAAITAEFEEFKIDYYKNKLEYENVTKEVMMAQAEGYIRAIIWNLQYYYNGCQSWSWYFPHHYSPYLSDLKGFKDWNFDFPEDKPFLPFQQLLAVLPAASRNILPKAFRDLMTSPGSPIIDYYPTDFETDLNGKKHEWEAVVLIPFIKEDALLEAMEPCLSKLTDEERLRNTHGPLYVYEYTPTDNGKYKAPQFFPDLEHNHSIYKEVWSDELYIPKNKVIKGLYPGAGEAQAYGFPTLKHVPFTAKLREGKVRVFEQPSRGSNMLLFIEDRNKRNTALEVLDKPKEDKMAAVDVRQEPETPVVDPDFLKEVADKLLGKEIYVAWPHLVRARVAGVFSTTDKHIINSKRERLSEKLSKQDGYQFGLDANEIRMLHRGRMGIELGTIDILLYAHIVEGVKYLFDDKGNGTLSYLWSRKSKAFPYQTVVTKINMVNTLLDGPGSARIEQVFYPGAQVFMLAVPHYGAMATVKNNKAEGRVVVEVPGSYNEPDFSEIEFQDNHSIIYYVGHQAAQRLGISPHFLSRITGTIYIQSSHTDSDKTNIGLNLKFNKSNQEVVGYTKKTGDKQWLYTDRCVNLINNYMTKFPKLFDQLSVSSANDVFFKADIFPDGDGDEQVRLIARWLKEQEFRSAELRSCGSSLLTEDVIKQMEQVVIRTRNKAQPPQSTITLQVKPHHLHIPRAQLNLLVPDPLAKHNILDRVVNVRESHTIPLGYRGTIIGIEKKEDELATLYDILFDDEIVGGLLLFTDTRRCYRLTKQAFINISYGLSLQNGLSSQGSQQTTHKWRKSEGHTNNNESRSRHDNFNTQKGFNASGNVNNFNNNASNTVSQFFSAYRQPNAKNISMVSQQAKEDSESGRTISLKPQQPTPAQPPKSVDAEFQAMWSQLQQKLPTSPPAPVNPPSSSNVISPQAVSEQTNALKKFLRINAGERPQQSSANVPMLTPQGLPIAPCGHTVGTCCAELASMCQRLGVAYPHCSQKGTKFPGKSPASSCSQMAPN